MSGVLRGMNSWLTQGPWSTSPRLLHLLGKDDEKNEDCTEGNTKEVAGPWL